jgi:hypothetical protein
VPAPIKRRHVSRVVVLPVAIAAAFLLVAKLVAMHRADIVAELEVRIAHRDTTDAAAAVRQLAAMSRPPLAILVAAATSGDRQVADEAKQAINKLLRRCERQIANGERVKPASRQLAELADALQAQRNEFAAADHAWLGRTVETILGLANQVPSKYSPLVALHCDTILATIDAKSGSPVTQASHGPSSGRLAHSSSDFGESQTRNDSAEQEHPPVEASEERLDASWRADWATPALRTLPPKPIDALQPQPPVTTPPASSPPEMRDHHELDLIDTPLASVDSRKLLQRWLLADGDNSLRIEQELARRGFKRLSRRIVQRLFSSRPAERLQFVDDVLAEPGLDARPWLDLLAEDRDADLRLAAVTIMATSNDAVLMEKAFQAAIHDRDPRIAGLAQRIRERRAPSQQR